MENQNNTDKKPLLKGGYPFVGFLIQSLALGMISYVILNHFLHLNTIISGIISLLVFITGSIYLAYKNLYAVAIYSDFTKVRYLIPHRSMKDIVIRNEQILAVYYKRTSGKGSTSKLVIIYWDNEGGEKNIVFPGTSTETAFVRVLRNFMAAGVKVVIDPEWALKDFGL